MKAMFLSDFVVLKKRVVRYTMLWAVLTFGVSVFMGTTPLIVLYIGVINPVMALKTMMLSENAGGWEGQRLALPLSRRDVILGHYAFFAAVTCASVAVGALAYAASCFAAGAFPALAVMRPAAPFDPASLALCSGAATAFALMMLGVQLPLAVRFGFDGVARYAAVAFLTAFLLGQQLMARSGLVANGTLALAGTAGQSLLLSASLVALGAVFYAGSATVALRLYAQKDF